MKKSHSTETSSGSIAQTDIDSCVTEIGRLTATISRGGKTLTKQEKQRMPRSRKDGASIAREIAQLAKKYGVDGIVDVTGMLSSVDDSERLAPLDKVAANFSVLVHDRAFASDAAAWKSATTGYTLLKRMAKDNPDMARDLEGVAASLKPAKKAAAATSGSPAKALAQATAATPEPAPEPEASPAAPGATQAK